MSATSEVPRPTDSVKARYGAAALEREAALCCPVTYRSELLEAIPREVIERDYGCGDPSRYAHPGDTVLDLGSGSGKICFIAGQIVGREGRVIGIDMTPDMLALAREAAPQVAERIGYANVEFRRGQIQDLALDLEPLEAWLARHPIETVEDLGQLRAEEDRIRREQPLVADASVDLVVSNCVLNLVRDTEKTQMIREIHRVLREGGRIAISDIVRDEPVPEELKRDAELWSGCVSGAFHERDLLRQLEQAGFQGIAIDKWEHEPFAVVEGIEFRSVTLTARRASDAACLEANQAVVYGGPWRRVEDDDGHVLERGARTAVCAKTYESLTTGPYAEHTIGIAPRAEMPVNDRLPFDCARSDPRDPRETKGADYRLTRKAQESCCE